MKERLVSFSLFGQEFTFYSDASDAEVEAAIRLLRKELEGKKETTRSVLPSSKMLVLGCLRMAAKYVLLEQDFKQYSEEQKLTIEKLTDKVSSGIK